ncbi:MAG TPA: hypothetical protein VGG06_03860 [Thermoanaerobaculia bacterium]|jgi:hypothetical protein
MAHVCRIPGWSLFALALATFAAVPAASQVGDTTDDPYGRSPKRMFQNENLRRLDQDIKREKEAIDGLSPEQREHRALAMVVFEPAPEGGWKVDLKVRSGGTATVAMKGARFDLGDPEEQGEWTVSSGSFEGTKPKPMTVVVTPPGQKDRKAVCADAAPIAAGERVAYCVIMLPTNGDFYCPAPDVGAAAGT